MKRWIAVVGPLTALLGVASLLSCDLGSNRDPRPEQTYFNLVAPPSDQGEAPTLTLSYPSIADQPLRARIVAVSDDGQRILVSRWSNGKRESGNSLDGGVTWTFGPERPHELWSGSMTHVLRPDTHEVSHDGGLTWTTLPPAPEFQAWSITNAGVVVCGEGATLYRLKESTWETFASHEQVNRIQASADGQTVLVNEAWFTTDDQTWQRLPALANYPRARVSDQGVLTLLEEIEGTQTNGIWATKFTLSQSSDKGKTWSPKRELTLDGDSGYFSLGEFFSSDGLRLFVSTRHQSSATWDGGVTWQTQDASDQSLVAAWLTGSSRALTYTYARWEDPQNVYHSIRKSDSGLQGGVLLRARGTQLDQVYTSADGTTVTGVIRDDGVDEAWSTQDGLTWTPVPVPPPSPPLPPSVIAQSADGQHVLRWRFTEGGHTTDHFLWNVREIRVIHPEGSRMVAELVDSERPSVVPFGGLMSDTGQVLAMTGESNGTSEGVEGFSLLSRDGGASWWKSPVSVLAWNSTGSWGIGYADQDYRGSNGYPLAVTSNSGSTWGRLSVYSGWGQGSAVSEKPWNAVFFNKGILLVAGNRIILAEPNPSEGYSR